MISDNERYRNVGSYQIIVPLGLSFREKFIWDDGKSDDFIRIYHRRTQKPDVSNADSDKCFVLERTLTVTTDNILYTGISFSFFFLFFFQLNEHQSNYC